ncbi:spore coat protein [Paenactinomyces guangxiensis]|uniref:Spore coat protein n=1 Tax=Paenactinomyces guangxiensis TaxID=1490290 RepID=A0A7W2A889_9BACL|nr:spore coat protein [Paenactinomyces guangxiensis]MBA4493922.1 spore coat protein [Paenactinomyces guangxiensis]MBH8591389.1 spore coat protein [Paenactinomyces guangxiensis]
MAKDYYIARDAFKQEDLAAKKYAFYAHNCTNPEAKQLFNQIGQVQQQSAQRFQQMMNQFPIKLSFYRHLFS